MGLPVSGFPGRAVSPARCLCCSHHIFWLLLWGPQFYLGIMRKNSQVEPAKSGLKLSDKKASLPLKGITGPFKSRRATHRDFSKPPSYWLVSLFISYLVSPCQGMAETLSCRSRAGHLQWCCLLQTNSRERSSPKSQHPKFDSTVMLQDHHQGQNINSTPGQTWLVKLKKKKQNQKLRNNKIYGDLSRLRILCGYLFNANSG